MDPHTPGLRPASTYPSTARPTGRVTSLALVVVGLYLGGPTAVVSAADEEPSASAPSVQISSRLGLDDLTDVPQRMREPLALPNSGELRLRSGWKDEGRGIAHCADYYDARALGLQAYGALDEALEQLVLATCRPLQALSQARPASRTHLRDFDFASPELRLPLDIAPILHQAEREMAETLHARGRSWRAIFRQASFRVEGDDTLVIDNQGIESTFSLLARADFDGDANEDLLVSVHTAATNGSRRPIRHVILTRRSDTGALVLVRELD